MRMILTYFLVIMIVLLSCSNPVYKPSKKDKLLNKPFSNDSYMEDLIGLDTLLSKVDYTLLTSMIMVRHRSDKPLSGLTYLELLEEAKEKIPDSEKFAKELVDD